MRTLVVLESFDDVGGGPNLACNLAQALKKMSRCIFVAKAGLFSDKIGTLGFQCISLPRWLPSYAMPFFLLGILRCEKINIVHAHSCLIGGLLGLLCALFGIRIPIIITSHTQQFIRGPRWGAAFLLNHFVHKIFAVAYHGRQKLIRQGVNPEKVAIAYNFTDPTRFYPVKNAAKQFSPPFTLVMAGRLIKEKRFDLFVRIVKEIRSRGFAVFGKILGDGDMKPSLEELVSGMGLEEVIIFKGYMQRPEEEFRTAHLFLFPSQFKEVLPLCLIEACACGLPIVASELEGNSEIVEEGQNGYLIDPGDNVTAYADKIINILSDPSCYFKLRQGAELFSRNKFTPQKYLDFYRGLKKVNPCDLAPL